MDGPEDEAVWLTAADAAKLLGVSTEQVRRLARQGRLPHAKVGRELRFKRRRLENLDVEQQQQREDNPPV